MNVRVIKENSKTAFMNKSPLANIYAWLIITGIVLGPLGLIIGNPSVAAFGNGAFIAVFFTPVFFTKKLSLKDSVFGGIWTATVFYFASKGDVSTDWLLSTIPMLVISILVSKWANTSFTKSN